MKTHVNRGVETRVNFLGSCNIPQNHMSSDKPVSLLEYVLGIHRHSNDNIDNIWHSIMKIAKGCLTTSIYTQIRKI